MNVIPFVMIFITVIALTWTSLTGEYLCLKRSTTTFLSHMLAYSDAIKHVEASFLKKGEQGEEKEGKKVVSYTDRAQKRYHSPRINTKKESSKFILSPDLDQIGQQALEKLLLNVYEHAPFFRKEFVRPIKQKILESLNENFEPETLLFSEESLDIAWYEMLKGGAWPAITDLISFQENSSSLLYSRFASIDVLQAVVGEDAMRDILKREEEKYYEEEGSISLLTEKEMKEVLSHHQQSSLAKYFDFSNKPRSCDTVVGKDRGIIVTIDLTESKKESEATPSIEALSSLNSEMPSESMMPSANLETLGESMFD